MNVASTQIFSLSAIFYIKKLLGSSYTVYKKTLLKKYNLHCCSVDDSFVLFVVLNRRNELKGLSNTSELDVKIFENGTEY